MLSILERRWLEETDRIHLEIQNTMLTDEEAIEKAKRIAELKRTRPKLIIK